MNDKTTTMEIDLAAYEEVQKIISSRREKFIQKLEQATDEITFSENDDVDKRTGDVAMGNLYFATLEAQEKSFEKRFNNKRKIKNETEDKEFKDSLVNILKKLNVNPSDRELHDDVNVDLDDNSLLEEQVVKNDIKIDDIELT